jgi:NTP pyrophosphatase (non-canonical NTP hydrolase)
MPDIENIEKKILQFRDERDWKQFHNSKDLALAILIEASELNELFLWKTSTDVQSDKIKDELADVLIYCILLAKNHDLDILNIIEQKLAKNEINYPIDKAKGKAKKYNEL